MILSGCGSDKKTELIEYNQKLVRQEKAVASFIRRSLDRLDKLEMDIKDYQRNPSKLKNPLTDEFYTIWDKYIQKYINPSKKRISKLIEVINDFSIPEGGQELLDAYSVYYKRVMAALDNFENALEKKKENYQEEKKVLYNKLKLASEKLKEFQRGFFTKHQIPVRE